MVKVYKGSNLYLYLVKDNITIVIFRSNDIWYYRIAPKHYSLHNAAQSTHLAFLARVGQSPDDIWNQVINHKYHSGLIKV